MKNRKKKKIKVSGVRLMCWILAGLMVIGTIAMVVTALIG